MAGQRQPGSWGLDPVPVPIDQGTSCRIQTMVPGCVDPEHCRHYPVRIASSDLPSDGDDAALESLKSAIASFARTDSWLKLQQVVLQVVGQQSFGLGVVYGIGENAIGSVIELAQLAKTLLLADLYDRVHQPVLSAAFAPFGPVQRVIAEVSMRAFGSQLRAAHREREELIAELRYAVTHPGEVFEHFTSSQAAQWERFESLMNEATPASLFEAGRIFGEVLVAILSLIGGGAAVARAASRIPRLAKLARIGVAPQTRSYGASAGAAGAAAGKPPATPSQLRSGGASRSSVAREPKTPPPRSMAADLAGSEFNGVKVARVRPGSGEQVAVVGRSMDQVEKYAQGLKDRGYDVEVFAGDKISPGAQLEWANLKDAYAPARIPEDVLRETQLFRENQAWAQKLADKGYTVVDIGNPTQQGLSPFYEMEKGILFPGK